MMPIIDYFIATSEDKTDLANDIRDLIGHGWQPFGVLVIWHNPVIGKTYLCQPMVKYFKLD